MFAVGGAAAPPAAAPATRAPPPAAAPAARAPPPAAAPAARALPQPPQAPPPLPAPAPVPDTLHGSCRAVFDPAAGQTWEFPAAVAARGYQVAAIESALLANTVLVLPTGLGKTLVAAVVIHNFCRWFPDGKAVFLAPTRPLVTQQIAACARLTPLRGAALLELTGNTPIEERMTAWRDPARRAFFCTPATFANDLNKGVADAGVITLVVVDECHHAVGNAEEARALRFLRSERQRFRALGLTATPGATHAAAQEVFDSLAASAVVYRAETDADVAPHVHARRVDLELVEAPAGGAGAAAAARAPLARALAALLASLAGARVYGGPCDPARASRAALAAARDAAEAAAPGRVKARHKVAFRQAAVLAEALEQADDHGAQTAAAFLEAVAAAERERGGKALGGLLGLPEVDRFLAGARAAAGAGGADAKTRRLVALLREHFEAEAAAAEAGAGAGGPPTEPSRAIVFTSLREGVVAAVAALAPLAPLVAARAFVGQGGGARKGSTGMKQAEQRATLDAFRRGDFNVLVATSVGEEGLDVPSVDLIICCDASASATRCAQRQGRTARHRPGRVVFLLASGREEAAYERARAEAAARGAHLRDAANSFTLAPGPRMVPRTIHPRRVDVAFPPPSPGAEAAAAAAAPGKRKLCVDSGRAGSARAPPLELVAKAAEAFAALAGRGRKRGAAEAGGAEGGRGAPPPGWAGAGAGGAPPPRLLFPGSAAAIRWSAHRWLRVAPPPPPPGTPEQRAAASAPELGADGALRLGGGGEVRFGEPGAHRWAFVAAAGAARERSAPLALAAGAKRKTSKQRKCKAEPPATEAAAPVALAPPPAPPALAAHAPQQPQAAAPTPAAAPPPAPEMVDLVSPDPPPQLVAPLAVDEDAPLSQQPLAVRLQLLAARAAAAPAAPPPPPPQQQQEDLPLSRRVQQLRAASAGALGPPSARFATPAPPSAPTPWAPPPASFAGAASGAPLPASLAGAASGAPPPSWDPSPAPLGFEAHDFDDDDDEWGSENDEAAAPVGAAAAAPPAPSPPPPVCAPPAAGSMPAPPPRAPASRAAAALRRVVTDDSPGGATPARRAASATPGAPTPLSALQAASPPRRAAPLARLRRVGDAPRARAAAAAPAPRPRGALGARAAAPARPSRLAAAAFLDVEAALSGEEAGGGSEGDGGDGAYESDFIDDGAPSTAGASSTGATPAVGGAPRWPRADDSPTPGELLRRLAARRLGRADARTPGASQQLQLRGGGGAAASDYDPADSFIDDGGEEHDASGASGADAHEDLCRACGGAGGVLLCCEACPAALHVACAGLAGVPEGDWLCAVCAEDA
jgi:ERCC4-related helicase